MNTPSDLDLTGYKLFSTPDSARPFLKNILRYGTLEYFDNECGAEIAHQAEIKGLEGKNVLYRLDHDLADESFYWEERVKLLHEARQRATAILREKGAAHVVLLEQDLPASIYKQTRRSDGSWTAQIKGWGAIVGNPELVVKVSTFVPPTVRIARPWTFDHPDIAQEKSFQLAEEFQGWATLAPRQYNMKTLEESLKYVTVIERIRLVLQAMVANLFMHEKGFVHGDIKPSNIDSQGKLFDLEDALPHNHPEFGMFTPGYSEVTYYYYLAGIFQLPPCTYKKDVFCWGTTLLQILLGITSPEEMSALVLGHLRKYKNAERALHSSIAESLPKELSAFVPLLQAMTRRAPSRRPNLKSVIATVRKLQLPLI